MKIFSSALVSPLLRTQALLLTTICLRMKIFAKNAVSPGNAAG
jgi:hypothetical protein